MVMRKRGGRNQHVMRSYSSSGATELHPETRVRSSHIKIDWKNRNLLENLLNKALAHELSSERLGIEDADQQLGSGNR